jgi:hypothetical protein
MNKYSSKQNAVCMYFYSKTKITFDSMKTYHPRIFLLLIESVTIVSITSLVHFAFIWSSFQRKQMFFKVKCSTYKVQTLILI